MKSKYFLRILSLLALLVSLVPVSSAGALPLAVDPPPAAMFQLPWDLGIAWVAIDGVKLGSGDSTGVVGPGVGGVGVAELPRMVRLPGTKSMAVRVLLPCETRA